MAAIGGVLHRVVETHASISKSQAQLFAPDQLLYNTVRYTVQLYSTSDSVRQAVSELDGSTDAQPTRNIRYG